MYTFDDIKKIEKMLIRHILIFLLATGIVAVALFLFFKNWGTEIDPVSLPMWPAYVLGVVYAVYAVFTVFYIFVRLFKYRAFVYSVLNGLEKVVEGKIIKIDEDITYDTDLEFYNIELLLNDKKSTRTLHLDAAKDLSLLEKDKDVKLKIFGNYIKDIIS